MINIQPVSRSRHGSKRWQRPANYLFAERDSVALLGVIELPRVLLHMPIGFLLTDEGYFPIAIQGVLSDQNLFVDRNGRWQGDYIPAMYLSYPFQMARNPEGKQLLCVNEESGLVTDGEKGEAFFDEEGQPAAGINAVLEFLQQTDHDRNNTQRICQVLKQYELIEPWPINVRGEGETPTVLEGLYRISESRLNSLPADSLLNLRNSGALLVAYCQLLSIQNLSRLGKLASQAKVPNSQPGLQISESSGIISFENL